MAGFFDIPGIFFMPDADLSGFDAEKDVYAPLRREMVDKQIKARGIEDGMVLRAMLNVKRHLFVPGYLSDSAYDDSPLPIGSGQTISQPYIVAYMTQALGIGPNDRVLEIGTGSAYQTAVLAEIAREVYTVERIEELAEKAKKRLGDLHYNNVSIRCDDGYGGWPDEAPFDAIMITAAASRLPVELISQLRPGGRMILPVGGISQELQSITRTETGYDTTVLLPVRFVPMVRGKE
jgi:protein-L-isoaspartate(D-aspartate) O-methyltransferase